MIPDYYPATHTQERQLMSRAHYAVNKAVERGELPHPSTVQCLRCGKPAEDYHHHHGYQPESWLDVEPYCTSCHLNVEREDSPKCQGVSKNGEPCRCLAMKGGRFCQMHLSQGEEHRCLVEGCSGVALNGYCWEHSEV